MEIKPLLNRNDLEQNSKLLIYFNQFQTLLSELSNREVPDEIISFVNNCVDNVNAASPSNREFKKVLQKNQSAILQLVEKELKLVPKNHYRNIWLVIGMLVIGTPIGVVLGISIDNMAFLGIGLPIGLATGIAIGTNLDNKAFEERRQLDIDLKY